VTEFRRILDGGDDDPIALALLRSTEEDEPDPASLFGAAAALGVGALFAATAASSANVLGAGLAAKEAAAFGGASATMTGALAGASTKAVAGSLGAATLAAAAAPAASLSLVAVLAKPLALGLLTGAVAMTGLSYVSDERAPAPMPANGVAAPAADSQREHPPRVDPAQTAQPPPPLGKLELAPPSPSPSPSPAIADEDADEDTRTMRSAPGAAPARRDVAAAPRNEAALASSPEPASAALPTASFAIVSPPATPVSSAAIPSVPVAPPTPASELTQRLAREVALLDRARAALNANDGTGALRALTEYTRARPSGNFDQEATVLRIRALFQLGDRAGAAKLAKSFVAKHPESRHAPWLRTLAE
jgi:hypothetical protein